MLISFYSSEELKLRAMESSKSEKKHKKKSKKEKHKKSSKHKKEKRKKRHSSSSDSDENAKFDGIRTPKLPTPPTTTINLDDDLDDIKKSKEIFSKLVGKRDSQENGSSKLKRQKLISTDPEELVNIIKMTIDAKIQQPTIVSSASESEG